MAALETVWYARATLSKVHFWTGFYSSITILSLNPTCTGVTFVQNTKMNKLIVLTPVYLMVVYLGSCSLSKDNRPTSKAATIAGTTAILPSNADPTIRGSQAFYKTAKGLKRWHIRVNEPKSVHFIFTNRIGEIE